MDFRATRHGHNCEPGPHSSDRTVSICSDVADDLLSTNQNYLVSVFAQRKVFPDDGLRSNQSNGFVSFFKVDIIQPEYD